MQLMPVSVRPILSTLTVAHLRSVSLVSAHGPLLSRCGSGWLAVKPRSRLWKLLDLQARRGLRSLDSGR